MYGIRFLLNYLVLAALAWGGVGCRPTYAPQVPQVPTVDLLLAARNGWVEFTFEWRPGADYYNAFGRKVAMTVRNLRAQETVFTLEPGYMLAPANGEGEKYLLTQRLVIRVQGGMTQPASLAAVGLSMAEPAQTDNRPLTLKGQAPESLRQLAITLADRNLIGPSAQAAVWAVTDGLPVHLVQSPDRAETELLRRYVALATRRPYRPTPPDAFFTYPVNVTGTFRFYLPRPMPITLQVVTETGQHVSYLVENEERAAGEYAERIEILRTELPNGDYRLRLVHQKKVLREVAFRCG